MTFGEDSYGEAAYGEGSPEGTSAPSATVAIPLFVQRSMVANNNLLLVGPHSLAQVGDLQVMLYVTHASYGGGSTPPGWDVLGKFYSQHSGLAIYTRRLPSSDVGVNISHDNLDYGRMEVRTYGNVDSLSVVNSGLGLVAPASPVVGSLLRVVASSQANGGNAGTKTLTPDENLIHSTGGISYEWYAGLVAGDDPTTSGATAPARTATQSSQTQYPQWVDVQISGLGTYVAPAPITSKAVAYMVENVGLVVTPAPSTATYMTENVGVELPPTVTAEHPQQGWGIPIVSGEEISLNLAMAKGVAYMDENVVDPG